MRISRTSVMLSASTAGLAVALGHAAATQPPSTDLSTRQTTTVADGSTRAAAPPPGGPPGQTFPDPTGQNGTVSTSGPASANSPFFVNLGTNGRACVTCHRPNAGWTITPADVQQRFMATSGLDPIFRTIDGSDSPDDDVSTPQARLAAYSMLLNRGDIRIGLPVPNGADFVITGIDDPYHYASPAEVSLFRRPLPATNEAFLSTVMWDGRETAPGTQIYFDLGHQALDAILTHEQADTSPSNNTLNQIVVFESGLYSAQVLDNDAGPLNAAGATGGPMALSHQQFFAGINNPIPENPPAGFNPNVFTVYNPWSAATLSASQQSIARGEKLFNDHSFAISNVPGFNDVLKRPLVMGTCTTCHNSPNAGTHSLPIFMDLGLTDLPQRTADFPLYTLKDKATGQVRQSTDPGRALVTGKFADVGKFKVPTLRDLSARAPYFHNGSAPSTAAVVTFYNKRFQMNLSEQEQTDLVNFLNSL